MMAASSPCSTHLAISLHCAVPNGSRPRSLSSRHCAHAIQVPVRGSPGQYLSQCALPVVCWLLFAVRLVFEGGSSSSRCLQEGSLAWLRRCCEITATQDQASLCQGSRNTWRWGGGGGATCAKYALDSRKRNADRTTDDQNGPRKCHLGL